jgi:hypothetical protein
MEFHGLVLGREEPMAGASLLVKIRADEKCISVPGARVIFCPKGLFTRDYSLPAGTHVVVQLCDGQHELTLLGTVRTSSEDSGLAIEFKEITEDMARRLAALLVAQQS